MPQPRRRESDSFVDAMRGVGQAIASERHVKAHLAAATAVVALGLWVGLAPIEWAAVALACGLVLAAELVNTAVERLADAVHPEHHPLVGQAKDIAAGAVLLACLTAAIVAIVLFGPRVLTYLGYS